MKLLLKTRLHNQSVKNEKLFGLQKSIRIMLLILLLISSSIKSQTNEDKYIGIWENETKTIQIEMFKTGNSYSGKIIKVNIEKFKQHLNKTIIITMVYRRENVLYGGTYFDLERQKENEIKLKLITYNHFFIKRPNRIFSKKENWFRIKN
jgi:uncharacterized protein (DUF2147 family)